MRSSYTSTNCGRRRTLVASAPHPEAVDGDLAFIVLRIENYQHIVFAYGKDAGVAIHAEFCSRIINQLNDGYPFHGAVYAGGESDVEVEIWGILEDSHLDRYNIAMLNALCEQIAMSSFTWKRHVLHVAISASFVSEQEVGRSARALGHAREALAAAPIIGEPPQSNPVWAQSYRHDMEVAAKLLADLDRGEIVLSWQPICHAEDSEAVLYHEGLARGIDASGQYYCPTEAIQSLERLGLIRIFDQRMVLNVLAELQAYPSVRLGVNISARSAVLDRWWDEIRARLAADPGLASRLIIEITETAPPGAIADVRAFMGEMRRLGCRFALDDFGTGYASIQHLLTLSPDIVKIASIFLRAGDRGQRGAAVLAHLEGLARALAPTVVVEGVETEAQSGLARALGLVWQQGYGLGPPSSARPWAAARRNGRCLRETDGDLPAPFQWEVGFLNA